MAKMKKVKIVGPKGPLLWKVASERVNTPDRIIK